MCIRDRSNGSEPRKAPETLLQIAQVTRDGSIPHANSQESRGPLLLVRILPLRTLAILLAPALLVLAGCTAGHVTADPSNGSFSISPGVGAIDTNCTGCNATSTKGTSVEQFTATLTGGGAAPVTWSVSGGDANSGPGTITSAGQYTPQMCIRDRGSWPWPSCSPALPPWRCPCLLYTYMALSPGFRADFRESLYRMIFALTGIGVTILSTVEVDESFTEFPFSTYSISFLTDDIIRLRYVSIDGQLRKIMVVIKMRGGNHAKDIREYEITSKGVVILGKRLTNYQGLISGIPRHSNRSEPQEEPAEEPRIGSKT